MFHVSGLSWQATGPTSWALFRDGQGPALAVVQRRPGGWCGRARDDTQDSIGPLRSVTATMQAVERVVHKRRAEAHAPQAATTYLPAGG